MSLLRHHTATRAPRLSSLRLRTNARILRLAAVCCLLPASGLRAAVVTPGLAGHGSGAAELAVEGRKLRVTWSEPRIVAVATKPEPWGFFQFPTLARGEDGTLFARWHLQADSIKSYGQENFGLAASADDGRTWHPSTAAAAERSLATALPNGERIASHLPPATPARAVPLPPSAGSFVENYSRTPRTYYPIDQLPPALQGIYLKRFRPGEAVGRIEHAALHDPGAMRYEHEGLIPVLWWGDLRVDRDGAIVAGTYPAFHRLPDGTVDGQSAIAFHRSTDLGRSWRYTGHIPYRVDAADDPQRAGRNGFTEPAFLILRDGTYLCVMRTTDGVGHGPMFASRSTDRGATWSQPEAIAPAGVLPQLLRLDNGVVALSAGRPGVQVRFAVDPAARAWTRPIELVAWGRDTEQVSCGYTGLVAAGSGRLVVVYSDFRHRTASGELRKAIKVRELAVTPF